MRQGIIFAIINIVIGITLLFFLTSHTANAGLDVVILQDGEEVFSTPLLYSTDEEIIWYLDNQLDAPMVLIDQEIIDYFDFDLTLEELKDPKNISYQQILKVTGEDTHINMLINTNGGIEVYEANCADKICERVGIITTTSKVITCAPHKLVIKLRGDGSEVVDA